MYYFYCLSIFYIMNRYCNDIEVVLGSIGWHWVRDNIYYIMQILYKSLLGGGFQIIYHYP